MARQPEFKAFIIEPAPEGSDRKDFFREVAAGWEHKNGKGFDLFIPAGLALTGRIVILKQDAERPATGPSRAARSEPKRG